MADRPLALVTGGARRVGRAITLALAGAGCDVIVTYRTSEGEARGVIEAARPLGASVACERLDLGDLTAVRAFAASITHSHRRLDVLVHNASVYHPSTLDELARTPGEAPPIAADPRSSTPEGDLEHTFRVNAIAPLILTAGLAPLLRRSILLGGGSVVALSDIHALGRPRRNMAAYAMSKAALTEMVESLALDLAPHVRVNGVAPGVVAWPEGGPEADPSMQQRYLSRVPLARAGTPKDAAEAVQWLAIDAQYITGQIVRVDGGRWLT